MRRSSALVVEQPRASVINGIDRGHALMQSGELFGKDINTQGLVTANGAVIHDVYRKRQQNVERYSEDELFGKTLGPNFGDLTIWEMDLLMAFRVPVPENGEESNFEMRPFVFPCLNALRKPKVASLTNAKLQQYIRVVGVAAHARQFGPSTNYKGGQTIIVKGSMSIFNRSSHRFNFGDLVRWTLPHVDADARRIEQAGLPRNEKHTDTRLEPILQKFDLQEAHDLLATALTESFAGDNTRLRELGRLINPDRAAHEDDITLMVLAYRLDKLVTAFSAITTWADYYAGRIASPADAHNMGAFIASYNKHNKTETAPANLLATHKVTVAGTGATEFNKKQPTDLTDQEKSEKLFRDFFVACKLGLYVSASVFFYTYR